MKTNPGFPVLKALFASLAVGLMSGCTASFVPSAIQPNQTPIGNIQGSVHGGRLPVTGAHIYLLAASTGGYGTYGTSLISSTAPNAFEDGNGNYYVVTDGNGNFALGGDYTCTEGQQVYMVAYGGNPGMTRHGEQHSHYPDGGAGAVPGSRQSCGAGAVADDQ